MVPPIARKRVLEYLDIGRECVHPLIIDRNVPVEAINNGLR
jgi:hypothetical protein